MDERKEGEIEKEIDENGFDPTKEAFFSDLMEMEEDIASEAYELVEHAMGLIETHYYDDAIEVLRQAIGIYTQINREAEIKAINEKISEIFILKEKVFLESEISTEVKTEVEPVPEKIEVDMINEAHNLLEEANKLIDIGKFEEALDKYDETVEIYENMEKSEDVERVYKLIEEVYNKKAEYLRSIKKKSPKIEAEVEREQEVLLNEEDLKEEKLQQYLVSKKREEEISSKAYEILGNAAEFAKNFQYEQALQLYIEGANLFKQLNWTYEVKKVEDTIALLEQQKTNYLMEIETHKIEKRKELEPQKQTVEEIELDIKMREEKEKIAKIERLKGIELQKMENEFFKAQIDNMATEAARMAREYELAMQKAIRMGEMIEECIYPKVIEIYKRIKELLNDKGWRNEAKIYDDTINIYIQKFEQDKKIREIEAEKLKKQKEAEDMLKVSKVEKEPLLSEEKAKLLEEQQRKEIEIKNIKENLDEMTNRAEKIAREYEIALRKGRFELKCPYPEIIHTYENARQIALEREWETDAAIFFSQIQSYNEKLEKDKKLRQIEAMKRKKEIKPEEILKVKKEDKIQLEEEKLRRIQEKKRIKEEEEEFEREIADTVNEAEKTVRDHEMAMRKALRKGEMIKETPYPEVIEIYKELRDKFLARGWENQAQIYSNQIKLYKEKLEKHEKLLEVEAQKAEREREIEEMHKIKRKSEIDKEKLKIIENKKEEEEFEKYIADMVDEAERIVRDHEMAMRKALRKGQIIEETPYPDVIKIYMKLRDKVFARGWEDQTQIYSNQIKIYQEKLEKQKKLLEVEAQKTEKEKKVEEMHKIGRKSEINEGRLEAIERKKQEEKEFAKMITDMTNKAEKLERDFERAMKEAMKKGEILEQTPYPEIIGIYKEIRKRLLEKGWTEQTKIYVNQIRIYQEKLEKYRKLHDVEAQKAEKQKEIEEMHKVEQKYEINERRLEAIERKKEEEEEFEKTITDMTNKAEKLERDFEREMKKAMKKGEIIEQTPYLEIIEVYKEIRKILLEKGWTEQAKIYVNQIKIYQEKLGKHEKLLEVEAQKAEKQKEIEEMYKLKQKSEINEGRLKVIERKKEEEEFEKIITDMTNKAEKMERDFEREMKKAMKKGEILEQTPYLEIIKIYEQIKDLVLEKGWTEQAKIYSNQIKIYQEKLEKHEKLLEVEAQKAEKQKEIEEMYRVEQKTENNAGKLKVIEKKKEEEEFEKFISDLINKAEKLERDFEMEMKKAMKKGEIIEQTPYLEIIKIYEQIKDLVLEKGWTEQAKIYSNQIKIYQEKLEKHEKLLEVEAQKAEKQKEIEEMYRVEQKTESDEGKLKAIEKKKEEEEFEKYISDLINKAEKLERDFERDMKKAMKKGEILEQTPYLEIIEIYKEIRNRLLEKGWTEQAKINSNQIKMYQEKLEKHEKLHEIEAQKAEKQKEIEEMYKLEQKSEIDEGRVEAIERKKEEEKEFEKLITDMTNKAEKLERDFERAMKKGEILEQTPYLEIIEIYKEIRKKLLEKGWTEQAKINSNQIKMYQKKLEKHKKLLEVEAHKAEREKKLEEMHKMGKKEVRPYKPEKIKEIEAGYKEEDILLDQTMNLIDEAEKLVKNYELSIKKDVLLYESPYHKAIANYEEAQKLFQKIGWNDEANRLINTIKFYREKKDKDEKLREIEKKKLEEPRIELITAKIDTEKELLAREEKILEFEKRKKEEAKLAEEIFNKIRKAERMAQEYEMKIKEGVFDQETPYLDILKIYRDARKDFEGFGWMEESMKLINTIQFYKEKLEKDKRLRALEIQKEKKREKEYLLQQKLLQEEREEQEKFLKQREEALLLQKEKVSEFESVKDKAFNLMDLAKKELQENKFERAIELYKASKEVFSDIEWLEGIKMVDDSIMMIKKKKEAIELEQKTIEEKRLEKIKIEEKLEEELAKAEELRKLQQEEKRKEFLRIQREKELEREISGDAYELLEQGTALLESNKFDKAYEKYIEARELFDKISWKREVSRINNELLFKLKRKKKNFEILEDFKMKKAEEEIEKEKLKEETKRKRIELEKQKIQDKRKLAKEEVDKKIKSRLRKAEKLIENFRYNEAILLFKEGITRLKKLGNKDEIEKISNQINMIIAQSQIPLITLEDFSKIDKYEKFESAYKALDNAQISISNNHLTKAISELNEAKFNLKGVKINKKLIKEIDKGINEFRKKLGKRPEVKIEAEEDELERLKARITARREERKKRVLDLLKK